MTIKESARETAERIWNDRISPALRGEHTINRSGIVHTIAEAIVAAYEQGKSEGLASPHYIPWDSMGR